MLIKSKRHEDLSSKGLGDSIAKFTKFFGIEPCGGCEQRQETFNRLFPYRSRQDVVDKRAKSRSIHSIAETAEASVALPSSRSSIIVSRQQEPVWNANAFRHLVRGGRSALDVSDKQSLNSLAKAYRMLERGGSMREAGIQPIYASTGGRRDPTANSGPLDAEGQRRTDRAAGNQTQPTAGSATPTSFACGVDVTKKMATAVDSAKIAFWGWNDDDKHSACQALTSWSTGDIAWDIKELRLQVTTDLLNRPFRPRCATSGAVPACGSSVTVGNSCHFAGSANYVIFGVMCRLCNTYYDDMLNKMSSSMHRFTDFVSDLSPRDFARRNREKFSESGMLYLIDLYKKYIPLVKLDPVASNILPAKVWSQAGFHGWPAGRPTPAGDRSNCTLTCNQPATIPLTVSWYPHLQPWPKR